MNLKVYAYFLLLCLGLATHTPLRAADPVDPENTAEESQGPGDEEVVPDSRAEATAKPAPARRSRWRCQISLRNLLLGTAVIGAGLGYWRYEQNQRDEATDAWVAFDYPYANTFKIAYNPQTYFDSKFNDKYAVFIANFGFGNQANRLPGIRKALRRYPHLEATAREFPLDDMDKMKDYLGYETWLNIYKTKKQPGYPLTTPIYRQRMERFESLMKNMVAQMEADFPELTPEQIDRMIFESSFKQP